MSSLKESLSNEDLIFFGKINASISHELKNVLAIISETAGLLNDLTEIAARGDEVDLQMINTCSKDIVEEIQRGFSTIKQMNTFSHSVDDPVTEVNLNELLELMINLAAFLSYAGKVHFDPLQPTGLTIITCPSRLQNLIYQTLVFAFESVGPKGEIKVSLHAQDNDMARITFSGLGSKAVREFPVDQTIQIARSISTEIVVAGDAGVIEIIVPQSFEH